MTRILMCDSDNQKYKHFTCICHVTMDEKNQSLSKTLLLIKHLPLIN